MLVKFTIFLSLMVSFISMRNLILSPVLSGVLSGVLSAVWFVFIPVSLATDPNTPSINPGQAKAATGNNVTIFSDQVFENVGGSKAEAPTRTQSGRSYGDEPKYNTKQREDALAACAGLEDNPAAQKNCFRNNMQQQIDETQKSIDNARKNKKPTGFDF